MLNNAFAGELIPFHKKMSADLYLTNEFKHADGNPTVDPNTGAYVLEGYLVVNIYQIKNPTDLAFTILKNAGLYVANDGTLYDLDNVMIAIVSESLRHKQPSRLAYVNTRQCSYLFQ